MSESSSLVATAEPSKPLARGPRIGFGLANLVAASLVAYGVFGALPARYWPIDTLAVVVTVALSASAFGLLRRTDWAPLAARIASAIVLLLGLALVTVLAVTASYLRGIYDQVGLGGAVILVLVAALALPYLVVLPVAELLWLGPNARWGKTP
jgi:hypothetical protein